MKMLFRELAKKLYFDACMFSGKRVKLMTTIERQHYVPVLNFHRVSPHDNPFYPPMHPDVFRSALKILQKHFEFSVLDDIDVPGRSEDVRPKMVVSFDDGYADFVEYALPILDELGIRANQNIIPACVQSGLPPWNVRIYDFFQQAPLALINEMDIPGFSDKMSAHDANAKAQYALRFTKFLNERSLSERAEALEIIDHGMRRVDTLVFTPMMTLKDCKEVQPYHDLGAHSFSHEAMALENSGFFQDDFEKCADFFHENGLGKVGIYAFPYGSHTSEQVEYLLSKGVERILLVEEKFALERKRMIPRFTMYGTTGNEVACRAMGLQSKGAI